MVRQSYWKWKKEIKLKTKSKLNPKLDEKDQKQYIKSKTIDFKAKWKLSLKKIKTKN